MEAIIKNIKLAEIEVSYTTPLQKFKVDSSVSVFEICKKIWKYPLDHRESFYAIYLDRANNFLGYYLVSVGGVSGTVVDIKLIIQTALKVNATSVILAHNHPSGNKTPSQTDIDITRKVKEGCVLLDIQLLDHLIVYTGGYVSLADEGLF